MAPPELGVVILSAAKDLRLLLETSPWAVNLSGQPPRSTFLSSTVILKRSEGSAVVLRHLRFGGDSPGYRGHSSQRDVSKIAPAIRVPRVPILGPGKPRTSISRTSRHSLSGIYHSNKPFPQPVWLDSANLARNLLAENYRHSAHNMHRRVQDDQKIQCGAAPHGPCHPST